MFTLIFLDVFALVFYNVNLDMFTLVFFDVNLDMFTLFFLDMKFFLITSYAPTYADTGNADEILCVLRWDWLALRSKELLQSISLLSSSRSKLRNKGVRRYEFE